MVAILLNNQIQKLVMKVMRQLLLKEKVQKTLMEIKPRVGLKTLVKIAKLENLSQSTIQRRQAKTQL